MTSIVRPDHPNTRTSTKPSVTSDELRSTCSVLAMARRPTRHSGKTTAAIKQVEPERNDQRKRWSRNSKRNAARSHAMAKFKSGYSSSGITVHDGMERFRRTASLVRYRKLAKHSPVPLSAGVR